MTKTFSFAFEELPLIIDRGFEAGLVNGSAEISYQQDGTWGIEGISLEGHKRLRWTLEEHVEAAKAGKTLPVYDRKPVDLDENTPIYLAIYDRLEDEWKDDVCDAVQEQLQRDREDAADEYRRVA